MEKLEVESSFLKILDTYVEHLYCIYLHGYIFPLASTFENIVICVETHMKEQSHL